MGFLDNLENNLNALERQEERDPEKIKREQERRESEREAALHRAPFVEALKTSPFTSDLLTQCRAIGREARVLVRFTWLGDTLRLDAGPKRLDLVPEPEGIVAVFSNSGSESIRQRLDLSRDNPEQMVRAWLVSGDK